MKAAISAAPTKPPIKAWDELQRTIEKEDPPPITVENVEALVRRFQVDAGDMLRASVEEVFDWLRPRCSEYKTNTEFEIGKRVVLSWMVEPWVTCWTVVHSHEQNLIALERVSISRDRCGVEFLGPGTLEAWNSRFSNLPLGAVSIKPGLGDRVVIRHSGNIGLPEPKARKTSND